MSTKNAESKTKVGVVLMFPEGLTEMQVREFLSEWRGELQKDGSKFVYDLVQTGTYALGEN